MSGDEALSAPVRAARETPYPRPPEAASGIWSNPALRFTGLTDEDFEATVDRQAEHARAAIEDVRRWWLKELLTSPAPLRENLAVGETPPTRGARSAAQAPASDEPEPSAELVERVSYQSVLDRAAAELPGWRRLTVRIPDAGNASLTVPVDRGSVRQPAKRTELTFDQSSGALTTRASGQSESLGQRIRSWLRFAHTGEVYGFVGQTIAGLASAGATVLVWTGGAGSSGRRSRRRMSPRP